MSVVKVSEGKHNLDFIISEANGDGSRDTVTFIAGAPAIKSGDLLGKVTASGRYTKYDAAKSDGTEKAAGISAYNYPAGTAKGVAIVRNAEVMGAQLSVATAAAKADLDARGIAVR